MILADPRVTFFFDHFLPKKEKDMDLDARGKAAAAVDRRARQRAAAAAAQQELTPEAIAAEEERQRRLASKEVTDAPGLYDDELMLEGVKWSATVDPNEVYGDDTTDLSVKLAEAVQPVLDEVGEEESDEDVVGIGRAVFQWILVRSADEDNLDGFELGLQVQVDEQPPGGFVCNVTRAMLDDWNRGNGLQGNRVEHKKFAAGLVEKAVELACLETGNSLIYHLEHLMLNPTETAVGESADDGDSA